MTSKISLKLNVVIKNKKPRHRLMENTKQEIGCVPYSSGVRDLDGRRFYCGRCNDPSSDTIKTVAPLRSNCFAHLFRS